MVVTLVGCNKCGNAYFRSDKNNHCPQCGSIEIIKTDITWPQK